MQGMLTWERLKKMCSNGKEVINYSVLCSQLRADQAESANLWSNPIPRPSRSVL
jgi:hypothetical protein